ncbi:uncharacterized protein BO96DRAFT_367282 [Aspergillus niger CBS 101883]|uniref:Contig An08c0010, genomic contig n=2 Tax=Aspergillus niger TaxID=5061 RepID=A2QPU1_ASPNC|nr:uncharacterized protein BO96DRAFT_367282 [Aspergillus niger CBS 101883]XP_059601122.1 uncharacterized protein An08g00190 [Aspergillus niger]PYH56398.1 hypothetical protein BO96DRAFT_367282 [Aspergillus niger CBS 101883]CAK39776.1 unnamed protein product [Aspergillus niger]
MKKGQSLLKTRLHEHPWQRELFAETEINAMSTNATAFDPLSKPVGKIRRSGRGVGGAEDSTMIDMESWIEGKHGHGRWDSHSHSREPHLSQGAYLPEGIYQNV